MKKTSDPLQPKKHLGQNFLTDPFAIDRIMQACQFERNDTVLEIGPGKGAITKYIAPKVQKLIAIEKDKQLVEYLNENLKTDSLEVIHADALKFDFSNLPSQLKGFGNLPYNVATPIIEQVIRHHEKFNVFYMTLQLEHGQKMAAKENTKDYGSFSCFVQYYADIKKLFNIGKNSFHSVPKVQSCFLSLTFPATHGYKAKDEDLLFKIIRSAFNQRRKTIENSLGSLWDKEVIREILGSLQIDPKNRAENLSIKQYVEIANQMTERK